VRAAMLVRAQGLVQGRAGVRPELVEAYLDALRDDLRPAVHVVGSLGVSDLGPLAEIAWALIEAGFEPGAKEGLAMLNANSFAIGWACLAIDRAGAAVRAFESSAALSFEGLLANVSVLEPAVAAARPYPGLATSLERMRDLLDGGTLLADALARELQDPLTFRVAPQVHGGARDALAHAASHVEIELRSGADNPLLDWEAGRAYSCGNFEIGMLAAALDYTRIALAQAATIAAERCQKLVNPIHSGLPAGLRESEDVPGDGLNIFVYGASALAVEARLLAQPSSLEIPTTTTAEGIEDRMSNAVLCARRLDELAGLCERLAAVELVTAAQAVDARGRRAELGRGTAAAYDLVRAHVAPSRADAPPPQDLDGLCEALPMLP
jgi:histidine ammonia-lyase